MKKKRWFKKENDMNGVLSESQHGENFLVWLRDRDIWTGEKYCQLLFTFLFGSFLLSGALSFLVLFTFE